MPTSIYEIQKILDTAEKEWSTAIKDNDIRTYKSAEKLFLLAINKSEDPIPNAHARIATLYKQIAFLHNDVNTEYLDLAKEHAEIALEFDSENLRAQFIKTIINGWYAHVIKTSLESEFEDDIDNLVLLFKKLLKINQRTPRELLKFVKDLMLLAEFCERFDSDLSSNIYSAILSIDTEEMKGYDRYGYAVDEFCSIKIKAESRL